MGEPTSPPVDWSFEGTILATGWAGIHGINARYDTSFVATFYENHSYMPISISPNGHWIVQVEAGTEVDDSYWNGRRITIRTVVVASTVNPHERYYSDYLSTAYTIGVLHVFPSSIKLKWWDEDTLVLGNNYDETTNHLTAWSFLDDELFPLDEIERNLDVRNSYSFVSPDWSRILRLNDISNYGLVLGDLRTGEVLQSYDHNIVGALGSAQWFADSSGFVIRYEAPKKTAPLMGIYNREGELVDTILFERESDFALDDNYELASSGEQFAFMYGGYATDGNFFASGLQIANLANHEIIDTCFEVDSFKWSQNSQQIAIMPSGTGQKPVLILDLEDWRLYNTGIYHDGDILFWRTD